MQPAGPHPARWRRTRASSPRTWQTRAAAARPATACSPSPRPRPARPARRRRRRPAGGRAAAVALQQRAQPHAPERVRQLAVAGRRAGGRSVSAGARGRRAVAAWQPARACAGGLVHRVYRAVLRSCDVGDSSTDSRVSCSHSGGWHKALAHAPLCSNTKHHEQVWRPRTCTAAAQRLGARYPPPKQPAAGSGSHAAGTCRRAAARVAFQSSVVWSRRGP